MDDSAGQPAVNRRIAERIRSLRSAQGLSLEALAARSGVSRSMLSLIERGETSPTAVVLDRIATGLGVVLASLFEDPAAAPNPVARAADHVAWRDPQSAYVRRNVSPPNYPSPLQLVEVVLPPGAHVTYETGARRPTICQQVWVQDGRVEVTVGKETYELDADDCLAMELNAPIAFRNPTRRKARYVVAIAGAPHAHP